MSLQADAFLFEHFYSINFCFLGTKRFHINPAAILFFILPVIYYLLFAGYGFADTDQGFIPGLSYRISLGQVPYLDFDYVRPPLSPILHRLELYLPDAWEMRAMRFSSYLLIWASVLLTLLSFRRHFDLDKMEIPFWTLGSLAFVFSAHNFPAMPWHTVDGIFFASIGIFFFSMPQKGLTLGLFAFFLSAMAKQPFALLFPLACILAFKLHTPKKAILGILASLMLIVLIGIRAEISYPSILQRMLQQITGTTSLADLFASGIKTYFLPLALFVLPSILTFRLTKTRPELRKLLAWAIWIGLALFPIAHAGLSFIVQGFQPMRMGIYHAVLMAAILMTWKLLLARDWQKFSLFLMMVAIAWTSGISWGYAVPVLYAFPGLAALLIFLRQDFDLKLHAWRMQAVLGLAIMGFLGMQMFPYRDAARWDLTENAGQVFDRLEGIWTSKENRQKLEELQQLQQQFEGNFEVLPAMPAAHYLSKTKIPAGSRVDWTHDCESYKPYIGDSAFISFKKNHTPIFVEKERVEEAYSENPRYRSTLLNLVLREGFELKHYETTFYKVYMLRSKSE